ncbi:MAG TPA: DUF5996 family protein [Usitatibacter sp.]|nr:DUF5996 family protein [Usitatibacter sp.]
MSAPDGAWPALPLAQWRDTYATLHMWMQVVGKLTLSTTPLANHWWNAAFHFTARGLATQPMRCAGRTLVAHFDFVSHQLQLNASDGREEIVRLEPMTVADFHAKVMAALERIGCPIRIWTMPVEVAQPLRFELDTKHRSYDRERAGAFWRALESMRPVFERFRCGFVGKCSPLHFFWGSFDLALTRFSGRRAPERPGADAVTREAYSHEAISHGFWPGGGSADEAMFYAYAAPEPQGFSSAGVKPKEARYDEGFREFLLPYEAVRAAPDRDAALLAFLESTYEAGARLARWPRGDLERRPPATSRS